jgi:hypothetical protein
MDNIFKCVNIGDTELTELEKEKIMTSDDSINTFAEIMIKKEKTIGPENKDKILNAIIAAVRSVSESLEPSLKNVAKKTLVSCFSEINDSIVMWSHYADKHRGFCIEYDFKSLPLINKTSVLLYPVVYQSELFDITDYIKSEKNSLSILLGIRAAITKSKEWEYEREWRLIRPFEIFTQEMEQDVPLPTAIYAGVRISSENNDFLKQYCKRTKISLFQAEMDEHKFKINFRHE